MAQLLTDAEVQKLGTTPLGRKHPVRGLIEQLQVGEKPVCNASRFFVEAPNPNPVHY